MDKPGATGGGGGSWHRFRVEKPRPATVRRSPSEAEAGTGPKDDGTMEGVESSEGGAAGAAAAGAGGTPSAPGSNLAMYACIRCRNSKKKCDRLLPECAACKRLGARCFFPSPVASSASQAASLRARVAWLSNFVDSLMPVGSAPVSCYDTGFDLHSLPHLARPADGATTRGPGAGPGAGTAVPPNTTEDYDMDGAPAGTTSAGSIHQQPTPSSIDIPEPAGHPPHGLPPPTGHPTASTNRPPRYLATEVLSITPRLPAVRSYTAKFGRMHLVRAYFRHMHRSYPFLYERTIIETAESSVGATLFDEGCCIDLTSLRLYLVMMLGLEAISRFGGSKSDRDRDRTGSNGIDTDENDRIVAAEALAAVRMPYQEILQTCLGNRCIPAVEVLMLLTIYALFDPDGVSAWVIVGIMGREAVLLGLNRRSPPDPDPVLMLRREFRHRLFWCIFSVDRLVASVYGLELAVQDYDSNLALPGVTTEEFAASDQARHITTLQIARQAIALRDIEGRCLSLVHLNHGGLAMSHPAAPFHQQQQQHRMLLPSLRERRAMIEELRGAADNWYTQGTLLARREVHAVHFHNTITWLNTNYHGMLMLLYCPSLFNSGPTEVEDLHDLHRTILKYVQSVHAQFFDRQLALNWTTMSRMLLVCRILLHCYFNLCCGPETVDTSVGAGGIGSGVPAGSPLSAIPAPKRLAVILTEQLDMVIQCESILHAFQSSWTSSHNGAELYRRLQTALRHRLRPVHIPEEAAATMPSAAATTVVAAAAVPEAPLYYVHNSPTDPNPHHNHNHNHHHGHNHSHHNHASMSSTSPASQMSGGSTSGSISGGLSGTSSAATATAAAAAAATAARKEGTDISNDVHDICDDLERLIQKSIGVSSTYNYLSGEPRKRPHKVPGHAA